ncbi:MAG TPA: hypothetical protein VMV45_08185 [Casimicrobiaceae bacterium]|nr:hypothetical protein [Casimicrobiaceae bacterium]
MVSHVTREVVRVVLLVALVGCSAPSSGQATSGSGQGASAPGQTGIGGPFLPKVREGLDFSVGPDWKLANRNVIPGRYSVISFVRAGEDTNNLKELLTVQEVSPKPSGATPDALLSEIKQNREHMCPESTTWKEIAKDDTSILYEWESTSCASQPEQHEIARIIVGQNTVFFIRYARRTAFDAATRAEWVRKLSEASAARR